MLKDKKYRNYVFILELVVKLDLECYVVFLTYDVETSVT